MSNVDQVFSFTSKVRFYGVSFPGREEGICRKSVRNVGTSNTVFATTERTRRKLGIGRIKDGAYYCYCAYVVRISRYSSFLLVMLTNRGIFLRGLKLSGESR